MDGSVAIGFKPEERTPDARPGVWAILGGLSCALVAAHMLVSGQKSCAIFGQNYGQAGAIDFFGAQMGLPAALSAHQSFFCWGPRGYSGECMMVMADRPERLRELFESVEFAGRVEHPLSMPYEHFDVYVCRGPKFGTLAKLWPRIKNWD